MPIFVSVFFFRVNVDSDVIEMLDNQKIIDNSQTLSSVYLIFYYIAQTITQI
jgi:hypothetical protein